MFHSVLGLAAARQVQPSVRLPSSQHAGLCSNRLACLGV